MTVLQDRTIKAMGLTKCIVKREKEGNLILFFPEDALCGLIPCYTGKDAHNEAHIEYFMKVCKPVDYDLQEVYNFVNGYQTYMRALPNMSKYTLFLVKRL